MKRPRTIVTDHALLRYLERVQGVDVEAVRCLMAINVDRVLDRAEDIRPMPMATGVILEGFEYCLTNGRVTTVMRPGVAALRTGRVRRERDE